MGLHIEINGDLAPREWEAIAALVAVMRGAAPAVNVAPLPSADVAALKAAVPVATVVETPTAPLPPADLEATLMAAAGRNAAPPVPAAAPPGVILDAAGLPWDARIHGSTKTTNKDQTWRKKRDVDPHMVAAVEAELRAALAAPGAPTAPPPPVDTLDPAAAFGSQPVPEAPAAPPVPVASGNAFAEFMKRVVAKQAAKTITTEMTVEVAKSFGLSSIRDLATRPDLIPAFEAALP